jgi:hypothetical protein
LYLNHLVRIRVRVRVRVRIRVGCTLLYSKHLVRNSLKLDRLNTGMASPVPFLAASHLQRQSIIYGRTGK